MKKIFLALLLAPALAFGISFEASNNITGQADGVYVNSPSESVAQTFSGAVTATSSLTVTGVGGIDVTYGVKAATGVFTNTGASSLDIGGGLNAGTGNVALVDATGKLTALSSTYLADLSGANLTGVVLKAGDSMSGQLTLNASSLTITGAAGDTFIKLIKDVDEYVVFRMPANPGDGTGLLLQTRDWNSPQYDTINALDITAAGYITAASSVTFSANNFSVGASTFVIRGGSVGIGATAPDSKLHISSGTLKIDGTNALFNISVSSTITTATDPCVTGDIRWDASYIFVCTATNAWERAALASW